jgi:hypothetical protein
MLMELSHPQLRTPMQINNATAHALLTNKNITKSTQGHVYALPLPKVPQRTGRISLQW